MKKTIIAGTGILVLLLAGILSFKGELTGNAAVEAISLGYCPTMNPFAEKIANNNENMHLVEQPSSLTN